MTITKGRVIVQCTNTPAGPSRQVEPDRVSHAGAACEFWEMVEEITLDRLRQYAPAYSPDGRWIAFARASGGNTDIFRMRLFNRTVHRLTHDNVGDFGPVYSPDGRFIAFEASHRGGLDIFTMRANGTHVVRLTNARGDDAYPTWAPR